MRGKFLLVFLAVIALASGSPAGVQLFYVAVRSTPPTGLSIGSSTGDGGTTNYTVGVSNGAIVNLQAPATDPAGYTFWQWTVNGVVQTAGQKAITFETEGSMTAVAQYTINFSVSTLLVQSTPPAGLSIGSTTGDGGTTNYSVPGITPGSSVNLSAPATDPTGEYTFAYWTLDGAALTGGQKSVTFPAPATHAIWGSWGSGNGQFDWPSGVAVDSSGNVYVADTGNNRIQKFTSAGAFITQWGSYGSGNGQFDWPAGVAVDSTGNVYVADTLNIRIQKFTSAGAFITQWGGSGTGNGQFNTPYGVAVDSSGNVYVADTLNNRIQKFTSAGIFSAQWGSSGSGNGQFFEPRGVAVDSSGNVYVADTQNDLIQKFTYAGTFITQWGGSGTGNGQFNCPCGVAVDSSGNVYVADAENNLIQNFTSGGVFLTQWGGRGSGNGQFYDPCGVAVDSNGNVYVADTMNDRIQAFYLNILAVAQYFAPVNINVSTLLVQSTLAGLGIGSSTGDGGTSNYSVPGITPGSSVNLSAPATDPSGYVFSEWTLNGAPLNAGQKSVTFPAPATYATWGSSGSGNGQFAGPSGAAVDSSGNVYVADAGNNLIQKFTSAGTFITQWGGSGTGNGQFDSPQGVAVDSSGNVYVADSDNNLIQKFTSAGTFITQWGGSGTGNGKFDYPRGVAVDSSGNVYVADSDNNLIQKFTSAGTFMTEWGGRGSGNGEFAYPHDVAAGSSGNVYVADPGNNLIQKFTSAGTFITQWGGSGIGYGQFNVPEGVAVDSSGNVYVADTDNDLIQKFTSAGTFITQWGSEGSGNGQFYHPSGVAVDGNGNVYVADTGNNRIQAFYLNILAVAQYLADATLAVQSSPPTGLIICSSTASYAGTTNYTVTGVTDTVVNLVAPVTDPTGYTFSHWTVNGQPQEPGLKNVSFEVFAAATAVAEYTENTRYTLSVQSTPPTKLAINSSTGKGGTTNYTEKVAAGASVNLAAAATDPAGYTFSQWTVNGAAQTDGAKAITFTMDAAVTAVAEYTANTSYTLSVQSTRPTKLAISSSTGQGGTTNYTAKTVAAGASVNLEAPGTDPTGYTFAQWTVNGAAQPFGEKSVTFPMDAAVTAVAHYTANTGYSLTVESTPRTGLVIGSSSGQGGTTNYTEKGIAAGASVILQAPATDPAGYTFLQWTVDSAAQTPGEKSVAFTMDAAVTAVAHYTANVGYSLTVESTPRTGLVIGSSSGQGGTTNYTEKLVAAETSVSLQAPATDPTGYTFLQWTVDGAAQTPGEKSVAFTMDAAVTAVAHYTANVGYSLTVDSTPPTGVSIGSSTGQGGTTDYTKSGVAYGASVNLQAPATDPTGYTFLQWTLDGAAQTGGQKGITFTMEGNATAVAEYAPVGPAVTLTVESTPPTGVSISSSTGQGGVTNYGKSVASGASVNLVAPAADPAGYTFSSWVVISTPPHSQGYPAGEKNITFEMPVAATAVAQYTLNGYTLTVDSTPPRGLSIASTTGQNGTTNYTVPSVAYGTSVNLQAPGTDPAGYTFSTWTLDGAAQTPGEKSVTFAMEGAVTAAAQYTANSGYTLTVESAPPVKLVISSSTGQNGTTNYKVAGVTYGTSVNLQAPAIDPAGYIFSQWTVNGAAQTDGQKTITFAMEGAVTAVADYTANPGYTLSVQSTPAKGQVITSSTSDGGVTNYTVDGVTYGTSVNLQAPVTDPAGYTFLQWAVNGAAQSPGKKAVTFTMEGAVTAVAEYTANSEYLLTVESTPPVKLDISSSTGQNGTTNYEVSGLTYGTSVNLQAPATDPAGHTFSQWTLNGAAQTPGEKSVTFTMDAAVTAVARYTANAWYTLSVHSTPSPRLAISSSTGQWGTTNYAENVAAGASVSLVAPVSDSAGYIFSQWVVNGAAQPAGRRGIAFIMEAPTTAEAVYTKP
jgi:DNA-binding beta-propeller fold protein YncE